MPTFNRAHLLPLAIKSVLRQSFEDFEVIVSNGGSTDNTKDVIAGFDDPRIRYVESEKRLNIGDNYQNALAHATGEYLTFLSDDDAFAPVMLERVKRVIEEQQAELVAFQFCNYYHDFCSEADGSQIPSNTLAIREFTGELTRFEKARAIEFIFGVHGLNNVKSDDKFIIPYLANAIYHRNVFSRIKSVREKLFASTPADMYLAAAVFFIIDSYYCLDEPLHIWSNWADNATASPHKKGNRLREHYEKLLNGETLQFTPLKFALPYNCGVNAILQAKYDFRDETEIDWIQYYFTTYENLMYFKRINIDVALELREFHEALSKESAEIKNQVNARIKSFGFLAKEVLRNFPFALHLTKTLLKGNSLDKRTMISGDENNFGNVLETADFLAANFLDRPK